MWLGAHLGISGGLAEVPSTGRRIGCEAIQIFSKSPQMWKGAPLSEEAATGFAHAVEREGIRATAVHHGYLINLASPKKPMRTRSRVAFLEELERAERLRVDALIFHPGAHLGSGVDEGIRGLVESLNWAFEKVPEGRTRVLLENAAGQGTALCSTTGHLRRARDGAAQKGRAGVAIDTCHLFAAGVDFRDATSYGEWIDALERELGASEVRAFHLNDAKAPRGSHLDRHENIGKGEIGAAGFTPLLRDPRWNDRPGYLETPLDENDYARYVEDLATLRAVAGGSEPALPPSPSAPPAARRRVTRGSE